MNFTKGGDDISESNKELEDNELKTTDWERLKYRGKSIIGVYVQRRKESRVL